MSASSPPSHQPEAQFSQRFTPPQSAQPYHSIFGSSSQNVDVDLQPYPEEDDYHHQHQDEERLEEEGEDDDEERDEIEDVLNEGLPPMADDSDDATYEGSDEDEDVVMSDGDGDGDREREAGGDSYDHKQMRAYYYDEDDATRKERRKGKQPVRESYDYYYDSDSRYPPDRSSPPPPSFPPSYRPNRYHGPAVTWRFWTQEERQNAEALENIRARDLSAHLFNAYALRRRARELRQRSVEENRPHYHRDEDEDAPFAPPARWTAWPMPANEVPRVDEYARMMAVRKGDDDEKWTLRMQPDLRPSAELEENLIAVMMRIAKERFWARKWMYGAGGEASQKKDPTHEEDAAGDATRKNAHNDEEDGESGWKTDPDLELFEDNIEYRPVVSTDDDKSRRQLRPLARQIITKLDNLLMCLHNARKASTAPDDSSASEMMTDTESVASSRYISPRKRRRTEGTAERSQSRGRKRTRTGSVSGGAERMEESPSDDESEEGSSAATSFDESNTSSRAPSRSISRGAGARRYDSYQRLRLGLRDWSDVLGVASMTGWPSAAVMRAARRCADLFGEDMVFHTLEEGSVQRVKVKGGRRGERVWQYIEGVEEEKEQRPPRSRPAPSASRSRSRARPVSAKREDISTTTTAAKDEDVTEIIAPESRRGGRSRRRLTKEDLVCPVKKCPRHVNGFSRTWNLNLHLKRVHPGLYSSRGGAGAGTGGESNPDEGNATTEQEQEVE